MQLIVVRRVRKIAEKNIISLVMSVCPSVGTEKLSSYCTDFHEIWYLGIFRKSAEESQVLLKSDKHNGCFTSRPVYSYDNISLNSS
jgi:hypothetical protein